MDKTSSSLSCRITGFPFPFIIPIVLFFILIPEFSFAHVQKGAVAGFSSGFVHPLSGWDHILAMIAVGLWGAQLGAPSIWLLPVTFPMMMAIGGFLGLIGVRLPAVEYGIAFSAFLLGLLVAFEKRLPIGLSMAIVGFFAIFHGYAHGAEIAPDSSPIAYSLGFIVSTGCLHGVGILIGLIHNRRAGKILVRASGVLIAAAGIFFLWNAFH